MTDAGPSERERIVATVSLALVFGLLAGILTELMAGEWTVLSGLTDHERAKRDVFNPQAPSRLLPRADALPGPWGILRPLSLLATVATCLGVGWLVEAGRARAQLRVLGSTGVLIAVLLAFSVAAPPAQSAWRPVIGAAWTWPMVGALSLSAVVLWRLARRGPPKPTGGRSLRWVWVVALALATPGLIDAAQLFRPKRFGAFTLKVEAHDVFEATITERDLLRIVVRRDVLRLHLRASTAQRLIEARKRYGVLNLVRGRKLLAVLDEGCFDERGRLVLPHSSWGYEFDDETFTWFAEIARRR